MGVSVRLSEKTLGAINASVRRPGYDRSLVGTGIVHVGVGGFHRAHQAVYADELLAGRDREWGICGAGILPADAKMRDVMKRQDCLYTVVERSSAGNDAQVIGSIVEYLFGPDDPGKLVEKMSRPEVRIVSLTITEGGYCFNQGSGEFDAGLPDIRHDLENPRKPRSAFGFIVEALARRRAAGVKPFTVMSCDNLVGNGAVARKMILALAALRDEKLAEWIGANVAFPNSMVDRITPGTTDADRAMVREAFGIDDAWPVVCEPFRQWIIEDNFCNGRPAWERVGAQLTGDVHPYETMKIRLLNASHSALGYLGYLAGFEYIHEIMVDRDFDTYVRGMMDLEVTPLLPPVPGVDLADYKKTLVDRFSNPTIKDQALRICSNGSGKMPKFILPSVRDCLERGIGFSRLALCVASWIRFLQGTDEKGKPIPLEDPMADRLRKAAMAGRENPAGGGLVVVAGMRDLFGELGESRVFVDEVSGHLERLYLMGARETLRRCNG